MAFYDIAGLLFTKEVLICLFIGTVGGVIIGALPGLSASMGVALMIPVTYSMNPVPAIVMLSAIYTSAIYGGSITASLINTPGTPASAATAMDGFALTKRGEGLKAIGICTIASMIGGTFSAVMLLLLAEPLAKISLLFGPAEYCLMGVFGLSIIGSLAGENMVKGLISGLLGVFIGTIGLDYMLAVPRYTFGSIFLENGINTVPAMIGMFALGQVMDSATDIMNGKNSLLDDPTKGLHGRILPTRKELKEILPTVGVCSVIGLLIGILPGTSGDVGSWVGYNTGKKMSKHPEEFGNGAICGIAASESANNAVTGGSMIPLLALGIPGSGTAALLLGGLMIHGLQPGYDLFTTSGTLTYAIIWGFLIANIAMGIIGLLAARQVCKVSKIPMSILCPVIIALCAIGSYAISKNFTDVVLMLIFGLLGYFMRKTGFASAPLILGLILSNMVESNYRRALILARGKNIFAYFFSRTPSVILIILIVFAVLSPVIVKLVKSKMQLKK